MLKVVAKDATINAVPVDERTFDIDELQCAWYLACAEPANGLVQHPVLGYVPTCLRCATKHDLTLVTQGTVTL